MTADAENPPQTREQEQEQASETTPLLPPAPNPEPYSVFTNRQKRWIILAAALASSFSPFSANIYYPSLNSIAEALHVTSSQINLTITTYMIFQGLAPTFMGSLADQAGRRPAYILCFVIYICGNVALALQRSYPALLVLRAVQSCGSSGTVALASAVAADIITSAERGTYMGIASLGNILAPSLGPILGGFLSQYLGWPAIFWFLAVAAVVFFVPFVVFFPETCRAIVGDGSIPAPRWNMWKYFGKDDCCATEESTTTKQPIHFPNPLSTLRLLFHLPTGFILLANGITFASYYAVTAGLPSQLRALYALSDLQIGLSFIALGLGSLLSATLNGHLVDRNYRRLRNRLAHLPTTTTTTTGDKMASSFFPIERARLQIGLPMTLAAALAVAAYGAVIDMQPPPPLWAALGLVFGIAFCITAAYNVTNVLIVDLYVATPATAMAANNLVRCFLGAAATAAVHPAMVAWGSRATYWGVAGGMVGLVSPALGAAYLWGMQWRVNRGG